MRGQRGVEPFSRRSRSTVAVVLALFAAVSIGSIAVSVLATTRAQHRAVVVEVAARQRTLTERYVDDVLVSLQGKQADPRGTARVLLESCTTLIRGGVAPAVNGDDDAQTVPGARSSAERLQLQQELRLASDLVATGDALLEGRPTAALPLTAGEHSVPLDGQRRLRVLAALTSNVALNAARTIATDADAKVGTLVRLEVALGALGLACSFGLGAILVAATRRQNAHFRSLVQSSSDLVVILDGSGACTYVSPSVKALLGTRGRDLLGSGFGSFVHDDDVIRVRALAGPGALPSASLRLRLRADDEWREVEATVTDLRDDRHVRGVVLNGRDVTERVALEEQINHLAFHDPLTGLANRALFRDRLDHALAKGAREGHVVAVLVVDLDGFKQVNDSLGHDLGDVVLRTTADRMVASTRPGDTVARLGGDEFAVVLEDADEHDAGRVAARVVAACAEPCTVAGRSLVVGASVGVALSSPTASASSSDQLVGHADLAMYAAKRAGKGRLQMFREDLGRSASDRLDLNLEIQAGIERGEFVMHFQPEVSMRDGRLCGVEALMRWHSPTRGSVSPATFIPAAESTSAIVTLGALALVQACTQTARWERRFGLPEGFRTWVNVSARQLVAGGLAPVVREALATAGLDPSRLGIEVTETALVETELAAERAGRELGEVHRLGVHIAIDDFGTGFSSLSHLRHFPIDALKVDRSFVSGLEQHGKDAAIVANVISLAHALGVTAVAEGVETPEQVAVLRRLGCDVGQGYLFGRPGAPDSVASLLAADARSAVLAAPAADGR